MKAEEREGGCKEWRVRMQEEHSKVAGEGQQGEQARLITSPASA